MAAPGAAAGADRRRPGAAVGFPDLRRPDRPDPDRRRPSDVVVTFLLINGVTDRCCWWHHRPRGLAAPPGAPARHGRRRGCMSGSSACSARDRGGAGGAGGDRLPTSRSTAASTAVFRRATKAVIENSLIVANAYLHEHAQLIRGDILGMADRHRARRPLFDQDRESFPRVSDGSGRGARSARRDADRQGPQVLEPRRPASQPRIRRCRRRSSQGRRRRPSR